MNRKLNIKLLQILYPGLGGHSSVACSIIAGDQNNTFDHYLLGYGIEKPSANLKAYNCDYVLKKHGFDWKSYISVFNKIRIIKPEFVIVHSTSQELIENIYAFFGQTFSRSFAQKAYLKVKKNYSSSVQFAKYQNFLNE